VYGCKLCIGPCTTRGEVRNYSKLGLAHENKLVLFSNHYSFSNVSHFAYYKGFYYDAHYNDLTLNDTHFDAIDKQAKKAVAVCYHILLNPDVLNFFPILILWRLPTHFKVAPYMCDMTELLL
jgi:threonyl-tRNA synthetase